MKRETLFRLLRPSALLVLLWLLATGAALAQTLAPEQVLRRGGGPEPETLDPHKAQGVTSADILRDLYQGLIDEAPDGALIPGVAQSWEISDDRRVYTFHLRDDARWSNGAPVTAQDFAYSLRRSVDPATGSVYSDILSPIDNADAIIAGKLPPSALGVEAIDEHTLRIRLKGPTPYFLALLTHSTTYPVYRPSIERWGAAAFRPGRLVGNGAYALAQWVVQAYVLLQRNPDYWNNARTTVDRVYYYNTEDLLSEFDRYRANQLDWTYDIPVTQAGWIRTHIREQWRLAPYLGTYYYGLNVTRPPFKDNPKLRLALSMAIDRDIIVKKVLGTGEQPAYSWVPPLPHYRQQKPEWADWPRARQLAEARRLYAEAGYSAQHPLQLQILYNTEEDHRKIAIVISAMWKQFLGVQATLRNEEFKVYLRTCQQRRETQVYRAAWIGDYADAYSFLSLLGSRNANNNTGYDNPAYDALLQQASLEPDEGRRAELMEQAERQLLHDMPLIPIYFYETKRLVKPWVVGWQNNIMDHHATKDMKILAH